MIENNDKFMATLPATPLRQVIRELDLIVGYLSGAAGAGAHGHSLARHCLRQVNAFANDPYRDAKIEERVKDEMLASGEYIRNPFKALIKSIERLARVKPPVQIPPRDGISEMKHRGRVEMVKAKAHLDREVRRVRREMGL